MMGALVGGHASAKANRTDTDCAPTHVVNGELAGRLFRLLSLTQQKQTCEGLEIGCARDCGSRSTLEGFRSCLEVGLGGSRWVLVHFRPFRPCGGSSTLVLRPFARVL